MSREALRLGTRVGPFEGRLRTELVRGFAGATGEAFSGVDDDQFVPPMVAATQLWEAQQASRDKLVPVEFQAAAASGVHGEHDLVVHRPLVPDEPLDIWVEGLCARAKGDNSLITLRYVSLDASGAPVVEQRWTTVWLGVTCQDAGESPPDHAFPDGVRDHLVATWEVDVRPFMARRYADVSGDWSAHHFEAEAARRSGAAAPFLHGLCTMALCARGVAHVAADGDSQRITRVAVRFARPLLLGETLTVRVYDAGSLGYAFEADAAGVPVIRNGRVELRPV